MAANVIRVLLTGDAKGVVDASAEARKALSDVETKSKSTGQKLAGYGKAAAAGIAGVALAAGAFAVKEGAALQESQDNLANALHDTGQTMRSFGDGYEPLLKKNEQWGHSNEEVNASLERLVRAGVPAKKALEDEAIAANLAASRHISLASATDIVTKVTTGHVSLLGRYGIATKDAEGKTLSSAAALELLSTKYAGAADAAGDTFQGKIAAAKAQLEDTAAKIGVQLIPILEKLALFVVNDVIPAIGAMVGWVENKLIPAMSKFGLSVADAYNKYVKPFVTAMVKQIEGIVAVVSGVISFVDDLIHGRWSKLWGDAKQIVSGVVTAIKGWFDGLPSHLLGMVKNVAVAAGNIGRSIASGILHGITGAAGDIANFAKSVVNALIDYVNQHIIDKLDATIAGGFKVGPVHISGPKHLIPDIPHLATGGVVTRPTLALIGEAGPEAVVPLGRGGAHGVGGHTFVINVTVKGADPNATVTAIRKFARRNGVVLT